MYQVYIVHGYATNIPDFGEKNAQINEAIKTF